MTTFCLILSFVGSCIAIFVNHKRSEERFSTFMDEESDTNPDMGDVIEVVCIALTFLFFMLKFVVPRIF